MTLILFDSKVDRMKKAIQQMPTPVRLPPDLKKWLMHESVEHENGNLNREIVRRLDESRTRQLAREARSGAASQPAPLAPTPGQ